MGSDRQPDQPNKNNPVKIEIISDDESDDAASRQDLERSDAAGRPPAAARTPGRSDAAAAAVRPSSVQLFGTEVEYRRYGKILLFNTRSILELVRAWLPFATDINRVLSNKKAPTSAADCLQSPLISWGSLQLSLKGFIFDLALTDLLTHYRPFGRSPDNGADAKIFSLEGSLRLGDQQGISFRVHHGKVFLACTEFASVMSSRGEKMKEVDTILRENNISEKDAFVKTETGVDRSLALLDVLELTVSPSKLGAVLRHLEKQISGLREKRDSLEREMEQTVQMINRQSITHQACLNETPELKDAKLKPASLSAGVDQMETEGGHQATEAIKVEVCPEDIKMEDEPEEVKSKDFPEAACGAKSNLRRTYKECSNPQCGRTYHFILSCCDIDHVLNLHNHRIPYMYHRGQIFLEKCSAFEAIGKTSIIRCSNYRKVDKLLVDNGLDPVAEFLQQETAVVKRKQRRGRRPPSATRNRRNHISLAALRVLVENNFISTSDQALLKATLDQFAAECSVPNCRVGVVGEEEVEAPMEDLEAGLEVNLRDVEGVKVKAEDEQSSSGVESEEGALLDSAVNSSPEPTSPLDEKAKSLEKGKYVKTLRILDTEVPYKILADLVFLKKTFVFKIFQLKGAPRKMNDSLERMIGEAGYPIEKAFLYEGRLSNYISTAAIRCVVSSASVSVELGICPDLLLAELARVEGDIEALTTIKHLNLKTMGDIKYQLQDGLVFFDTLKLLRLADVHISLVNSAPSKANFFVKKLLQDRGVNISTCFLKQRNSKYAFINLRSALILLQYAHDTENKERALRLKKELLIAAHKKELLRRPSECSVGSQNYLKISNDIPNLRYKIKAGNMYFHRKTIFDSIGLETVIYGTKKGFLPINMIITDLGFDFSQVYLSNQQEVFAYISASTVLLLLESVDPIMALLPRKQNFRDQLLHAIEFSVCSLLGSQGNLLVENHKVAWLSREGRLFLERDTVFSVSRLSALSDWAEALVGGGGGVAAEDHVAEKGLDLERDFVGRGADATAFIGVHALLALFAQECDSTRSRESHSLLLRDTLSAISIQEPRLRYHIRMSHFRLSLVNKIITEYLRSLQESGAGLELDTEQEESGLELDQSDEEQASQTTAGSEQLAPTSPPQSADTPAAASAVEHDSCMEAETEGSMEKLRRELIGLAGGAAGGSIGDWELVSCEPVTQLSVKAGYGASRKLSFLQPDVAAILKYDLYIDKDTCRLSINDRRIDDELISKIILKSEGGLSLLYQLLSLRPCFGSFSPELVETVGQTLEQLEEKGLSLDYNFIGSSSHGRTYAGTVRSAACTYVAQSRVADRCVACNSLDNLVINRSLLSGEVCAVLAKSKGPGEDRPAASLTNNPSHQSVWKLDTTDERGCSFLCPQVQTFNSSLPHAFVGSAQATTIVDHRVEISDKLELKVELCGKAVSREFAEFSSDHQLGPLLDKVAAMRLCIGYPDARLVDQARFILNHQGRMIPEMRKLLRHFCIDEEFNYRCGLDEELGTIRSVGCTIEAELGSDICSSCRGLQQPMEFL